MQSSVTRRRAVVIDCEMAESFDGSDELISLCAIDFLTGEMLIDSFVSPSRRITDWRTKIHGIDAAVMIEAVKAQNVLHGWAAARAELWKHIDENTVLIRQTVLFDFEALCLIHTRIVDSAILATQAVFYNKKKNNRKPRWRWGLQELCETFLGIHIRSGDGIHSNLEDVLAAREGVLQYLLKPDDFKKWADNARENFWKPKTGSKNLKKKKTKKKDSKKTALHSLEQAAPALEPIEEYEGFYDSHDDDDFYYHDVDDDEIFKQERGWFIKLGIDIAYY
ncbi:ribonuclease H-like domain-containing protein [Trichoderma barbatum]